jgi:hypothetical protein
MLDDWAESYRLDRAALRASICNAIANVRFKDPSGGVAGDVAAELISSNIGLKNKDAEDIAGELIEWILGQEISLSDWHNAKCSS